MTGDHPPLRLTFLGTGAAESYPAPFCRCPNCEAARGNRGRDLRRRSALLVGNDLLIDFGPDVFQALQQFGLDATGLRDIIITHGHADHLAPENLEYRRHGFVNKTDLLPLTVHGPVDAIDLCQRVMAPHLEDAGMNLECVTDGDSFAAGAYLVRALPAVHGGGKWKALVYLVERAGRRFLYATDTGLLPDAAWDTIAAYPPSFAILDATMGTLKAREHMGMEHILETTRRLRQLCGDSIEVVAHHFSHQANPCYEELVRLYGADGIRVSYDGMVVEVG